MFGVVLASDWLKRQLLGPDLLEHFGDVFEVFSVENHAIVFDVQFKVLLYLLCGSFFSYSGAGVYSI